MVWWSSSPRGADAVCSKQADAPAAYASLPPRLLPCCCTGGLVQEGQWKFIEGKPVNPDVHKAIEKMISQMNRGIETLKPIQPVRRR